MAIFDKIRKMTVAHRKTDEVLYAVVAQEMASGARNSGLWLKALEQADGNKEKQVAEYIKLRVQSLKDDMNIFSELSEIERRISKPHDIDEFTTLLGNGSPLAKIKAYVTGLSPHEIQEFINQPDACEDYPIHITINKSQIDLARWLLISGANPQLKNYWGKTALEIAERKENKDYIALLEQYAT